MSSLEKLSDGLVDNIGNNENGNFLSKYKLFNEFITNNPCPVAIINLGDGKISAINSVFVKNIEFSEDELLGKTAVELGIISQDVEDRTKEIVYKYGGFSNLEVEIKTKSGMKRNGLVTGQIMEIYDKTYLIQTIIDITEQKTAEIKVEDTKKEYEAMLLNISEVVGILNTDGSLRFSSPNVEKFFGWTSEEIKNGDIWANIHPEDIDRIRQIFIDIVKNVGSSTTTEYRYRCKDDNYKVVEIRGVNLIDNPAINGILINYRDITKRKQIEEEIRYLSQNDALTGLYNRAFFETELKRLDTKRQLPLSLIMMDLDGLKLTNDVFGHSEGDNLLIKTAEILKESFRSEDIVARLGGDEFIVVLPNVSKKKLEQLVDKLHTNFLSTIDQKIPLHVSIGVATKENVSQNIFELLKNAEANMYKRKLLQKDTISSAIVSTLEQTLCGKGYETKEHINRVKEYALKLGKSIKLFSSDLDDLALLASLHDIGKVAISEEILTKETDLTEEEWDIIKRHTEIGSNIVRSTNQLAHIANDILSSHERWDGHGYPRGLREYEIPLISRIICLVDSYDVMTNQRIYRKVMSKNEAILEIKKKSGTQFDPMLVDKFLMILKNEI